MIVDPVGPIGLRNPAMSRANDRRLRQNPDRSARSLRQHRVLLLAALQRQQRMTPERRRTVRLSRRRIPIPLHRIPAMLTLRTARRLAGFPAIVRRMPPTAPISSKSLQQMAAAKLAPSGARLTTVGMATRTMTVLRGARARRTHSALTEALVSL